MPTHKGEHWLHATLSSLARQADDDVAIILVDNSPTPATTRIARGFADRLSISVHHDPAMRGWAEQTNYAVGLTRAKWVTMLHQDDLWLDGRLAAIRRWIADDADAVLHIAPTLIVDGQGRTVGRVDCPIDGETRDCAIALFDRLLVQNFVMTPTPVIRRDAWIAAGGLDETLWYTPDWDLWLKLAGLGPVRHHREVTAAFRIHGGSQTVTGSRDLGAFREQMELVLARHAGAGRAPATLAAANASIAVNTALAGAASGGGLRLLGQAMIEVLGLGPRGIAAWLRDSRIVDRLMPRIRAKLAGNL